MASELRQIDAETARNHYGEHQSKPFFADLVAFITRSPSLIVVLGGPTDGWRLVRLMLGATDPREAAAGTLRGDYAMENPENLVHASDSAESAEREIALFFPGLDTSTSSAG